MAVPTKPQGSGGIEIARPQGQCGVCQTAVAPGQKFISALMETPQGFVRRDCCPACWPTCDRKDIVAFWQATMPAPEQKKKRLFVNDEVLCDLLVRLDGVAEPAKLNFRFVLGLILMRKKLLNYEGCRNENGHEVWSIRLRGREESLELVNPNLDEAGIAQVSQQMDEILSQEV